MTNNDTLATIATEIETLSGDLLKVNSTIDLIGKPAMDTANKIDKALKDAKDRFATALADQAIAEREQRLSAFSDIRVDVHPGYNLIDTGFLIHYMQDSWDMSLKTSVPRQHTCNGFSALSDATYEYLITVKPEAIPDQIMALAPGNPEKAVSVYMAGKARGFFKAVAA